MAKCLMIQVARTYENNPEYPYEGINMDVILQLQAGQEVWIKRGSLTSIYGADSSGMFSWFCGHLIHAL